MSGKFVSKEVSKWLEDDIEYMFKDSPDSLVSSSFSKNGDTRRYTFKTDAGERILVSVTVKSGK